ncbi:hypothetical protein [Rhizobium sp. FKY42]|uniref:hypothetical protein n=1 Tax=Rhizobium sp. FKY42 TaxID=2562310 RepID=UPI0010C09874|nr:hypothetical protein [Rhizobium sp. FKY42]
MKLAADGSSGTGTGQGTATYNPSTDGRLLGYDESGNPISDRSSGLLEAQGSNSINGQKVDATISGSGTAKLFSILQKSDPKIQNEILHQFDAMFNDGKTRRNLDGMDIYEHPEKYSLNEKVARYAELLKAKSNFAGYLQALVEGKMGESRPQRNADEINKDLDQAMQTLAADPEVASKVTQITLDLYKRVLNGETFDADADHGDAYKASVATLKTDLETAFKTDIIDGGYFKQYAGKEKGNELSILTGFNNYFSTFGSVLSNEFMQANGDAAQNSLNGFYSQHVSPLLPDAKASMQGMINLAKLGKMSASQFGNLGSITPLINGSNYGNMLTDLKTSGVVSGYSGLTASAANAGELRKLGVKDDALNSTLLSSARYMANSKLSTASAVVKDGFTKTLISESRTLIELADQGKLDDAVLDSRLGSLQAEIDKGAGPNKGQGGLLAAGIKAMVRGSVLTSKMANYSAGRDNTRPIGNGNSPVAALPDSGISKMGMAGLERLTGMAIGFEGKGIASGQTKLPVTVSSNDLNSMFQTQTRAWDAALIKKYGATSLRDFTGLMVNYGQSIGMAKIEQPYYSINDISDKDAMDTLFEPLANAVAKGTLGDASTPAGMELKANITRVMWDAFGLLKPGGTVQGLYNEMAKLMNTKYKKEFSVFNTPVKLDYATRIMSGGIMGMRMAWATVGKDRLDSTDVGFVSAMAIQGAGMILTGALAPKAKGATGELKILEAFGDEVAAKQVAYLEKRKTNIARVGIGVDLIANAAWLGVDLNWLIRGWKKMDTHEKVFVTGIVATDFGAAVLSGLSAGAAVASATGATRVAQILTTITAGSAGTGVGLVLAGIGQFVTLGLQIWQEIKQNKAEAKYRDTIYDSIWKLTRNDVPNNYAKDWDKHPNARIGRGPGSYDRSKLSHAPYQYGYDANPYDWAKVKAENDKKYAARYSSNPQM